MIPYCKGKAIIADRESGQKFEIGSSELDFQRIGGYLGSGKLYKAIIKHQILGVLSWSVWEYSKREITFEYDVGKHQLVQDFDFGDNNLDEEVETQYNFADLTEEEQIKTMVDWFNRMYEDPQIQMPYAMDKDSPYNYEYIWGGPYNASEELQVEFSDIANEETIEKATKIVQDQNGIYEWAPSDNHPNMLQLNDEASAEKSVDALTIDEIRQRLSETPVLTIGTKEEIKARKEIFGLISELQSLIAKPSSESAHGGIGHNQPPAEFEIPTNLSQTININLNVIVKQAEETETDVAKVTDSVDNLQTTQNELKDFVKKTKDQVKSQGTKALAKAIVDGLRVLIFKSINWLLIMLGI
ncbi:MAG: hypothetical protein OXH65_00990 [Paracoccaceae bacterium]|nr:hypothetical protein [Paracoccaceae bacterium]MDE2673666.1 hypothetical protein [Paracoccaceae bacterium]